MNEFTNHPLYRKHNIDSAMNSLWEFYKTRFLALFLISLVMSFVIQYATSFIDIKGLQEIAQTNPMMILEKLKEYIVPFIVLLLISLLFNTFLHYYVLFNPLDKSNNIFLCILKSLKYYIPYLIIIVILAFVGSFAIALGLMVLVIGVFFSLIYVSMISLFIMPVMMVEGINIGNTIVRTAKLSHTGFWSNMGWVAVFLILFIIVSVILSSIILIPFAGSFFKTFMNPQDTSHIVNMTTDPIFIFLSSAINALTLPLIPIFAFILYFNGRAREEKVVIVPSEYNGPVRVEDLYAKPRSEEEEKEG